MTDRIIFSATIMDSVTGYHKTVLLRAQDERSFIYVRLVNKSFRRPNMVKEEFGIWSVLLRKVCACKTDPYDLLFRE